jgi:predicted dehydrogenase
MSHATCHRRSFLKASGLAIAAGVAPFDFKAVAEVPHFGEDKPTLGCIGMGDMGLADAIEHSQYAKVLAVCDVDEKRCLAAKHSDLLGGGVADAYGDYRRLLDRKDIDVVSIATPDHWHVKIAIEALQAGKHVFCQKPLTLTLEENTLIRKACEAYKGQTFCIGTQQRADRTRFLRAVNMVQKGLLGEIRKIVIGIDGSPIAGPFNAVIPPAGLDWYRWLGQAPLTDYMTERCHGSFRWWYDYSGGKFTDWGAHHIDIALWALGYDLPGTGPVEINGTDATHPVKLIKGNPVVDNAFNTCSDFNVICRFGNQAEMHVNSRSSNGILFEGTKGRLFVNRGRISGKPIEENWDEGHFSDAEVKRLYRGKDFEPHKANFYRTISEGGSPVSDWQSHLQTMNVCHLCAIAARLQRTVTWDPGTEQIIGDDEASSLSAQERRPGFDIPVV